MKPYNDEDGKDPQAQPAGRPAPATSTAAAKAIPSTTVAST